MCEFEEALSVLIHHQHVSVSKDQIADIARSLDLNKDGFIDFNEFLEAFRIVDPCGIQQKNKSIYSMNSNNSGDSSNSSENINHTEIESVNVMHDEINRRKISNLDNIYETDVKLAYIDNESDL